MAAMPLMAVAAETTDIIKETSDIIAETTDTLTARISDSPATVPAALTPEAVDSMAAHYLRLVTEEDATGVSMAMASALSDGGISTEKDICFLENMTNVQSSVNPSSPLGGTEGGSHPWLAAAEVIGINAFVQCFDRFVLDAEYAQINLHTIHHNFKTGFVWDNDQFSTNLFAHPYHGGLYFNAARSNGLNFWQSAPYAFGGSLMWETMCEIEPPAINDLMATTIGGIAIGEVTYRVSDLIYDDSKRGMARFWREFLGTVVCPIRGLNRIIRGEAWRVRRDGGGLYHDYDRLPVALTLSAGMRYLADDNALFRGETNPYVDVSLVYGDPYDETVNRPYDYFTADVTFGLSSNQPLISRVHLLGQLWSAPVYSANGMQAEFGLFQHFNYYDSQPVKDGTSLVPFRISEAASVGPGLLYRFPAVGNLARLEQRIFLSGILLGGSLSDYYAVIDRDYNMGSGYSMKVHTLMDFGRYGSFFLGADLYNIYTWKGYESHDLRTVNPLYLNAQGDKGSALLFVLTPRLQLALTDNLSLDFSASYYFRETHYSYHDDVRARTFTAQIGLAWSL